VVDATHEKVYLIVIEKLASLVILFVTAGIEAGIWTMTAC
jgi:hypothetical protein